MLSRRKARRAHWHPRSAAQALARDDAKGPGRPGPHPGVGPASALRCGSASAARPCDQSELRAEGASSIPVHNFVDRQWLRVGAPDARAALSERHRPGPRSCVTSADRFPPVSSGAAQPGVSKPRPREGGRADAGRRIGKAIGMEAAASADLGLSPSDSNSAPTPASSACRTGKPALALATNEGPHRNGSRRKGLSGTPLTA